MHLTGNFAYNVDYFLHPTPTCNTALRKASCVVIQFLLVSTDIDSCLPHNVEKFMVHNHSGCACFQMGILHFHRNHRSRIAIIAWYYAIIGISIQLSSIVVASPLPSSTSTTSSSRNVILFLSPSSSSYTSSFSIIICCNTSNVTWYFCTFWAC